jgi:hypothetical protein
MRAFYACHYGNNKNIYVDIREENT